MAIETKSCDFCGGPKSIEHGATSLYFAKVTKGSRPWPVEVFLCTDCGIRQFALDVSEEELTRLYDDYRGERYFRERNSFEPWYTRKFHDSLENEDHFDHRRRAFLSVMERCGVRNEFDCVLDHGGHRGQMIADSHLLNAKQRFVFDVGGVTPCSGVQSITREALPLVPWDLILSCHVLEHVLSPKQYLDNLMTLGRSGCWYFLEVPLEIYGASYVLQSPTQRYWVEWLCKTRIPFMFVDFISTIWRTKLGYVPPFCLHPVREHLQFFTVKGFREFLVRSGLEVHFCDIGPCGGAITAVARKA